MSKLTGFFDSFYDDISNCTKYSLDHFNKKVFINHLNKDFNNNKINQDTKYFAFPLTNKK